MVWAGMLSPGSPLYLTGRTVRLDGGVPVGLVSSVIWSAAGFSPRTNPLFPLRC